MSSEVRRCARVEEQLGVHRPAELVGGEEVQPVVPHDRGRGGDGVQRPLQAWPDAPLLGPGAAENSAGAVSLPGKRSRCTRSASSSCRARASARAHRRTPGQRAAFELGVVLHAHPGQRSDLAAS